MRQSINPLAIKNPRLMPSLSRLFPFLIFSVLIALSGCVTTPPVSTSPLPPIVIDKPITQYKLSGRISIAQAGNGNSGNIRWMREGEKHEIQILSPLGQILARLYKTADGYTLTTAEQKIYTSADSEQLMRDVLGYALPVSGLEHWILGRTSPTTNYETQKFPDGRIETLTQDGWKIVYGEYVQPEGGNGVTVPKKIALRRDDMVIKLVIDSWVVGDEIKN